MSTTRILTAGWVVMVVVVVGVSRPVLAQSRPVASQAQNQGQVDEDGLAIGEPVATVGNSVGGAIGAAKRYYAPQITDKDVELGDVSAQQFLQSDTLAKLAKDPAALKLLSDADQAPQTGDSELKSALKNPNLAAALRPYGPICHGNCLNQFLAALQNPSLAKALENLELAAALRPYGPICHGTCLNQFLAALQNPSLAKALQNPELAAALRPYGPICHGICLNQFLAALQNPSLVKALQNPELAAALRPYGPICHGFCTKQFLATLQDPSFAKALQNPQVFAALQNPALRDALADRH